MTALAEADLGVQGQDPNRTAGAQRMLQRASVAVLTLGGALRLRQFLADRALWLDELSLSLNVIHRSYSGLLRPLDSNQGAPVGWLWTERTSILAFGHSEQALRLLPLLLSLGALPLFFVLARRWLGAIAQLVACSLFALAPDLINYAAQVKQYGTDVFFVLLVVVLSGRVDDDPTRRRVVVWAALSILAMWCSHAAVFVLAACGLVLFARLAVRSRGDRDAKHALMLLSVAGIAFAISLLVEYNANLRAISDNRALRNYWRRGYPPKPFHFGKAMAWLWHALVFLMTNPFDFGWPRLALWLVIVGAGCLIVRRRSAAAFIIAPVVTAIVLALTSRYPLHERLALYLAPFVFIAIAAVLDLRVRGRAVTAAFVAIAFVVVTFAAAQPAADAVRVVWKPTDVTDSRGPFAYVAAHWKHGDALFVENPWSRAAFAYYGPRYHLVLSGYFSLESASPCVVNADRLTAHGYRRIWFVLTDRPGPEPPDRNHVYRVFFRGVGAHLASHTGYGQAAAYLYDVGSGSTVIATHSWVKDGCLSIDPVVHRHKSHPSH